MIKFCAALMLLLPFAANAGDTCSFGSCEKIFHINENHPKLQGLEIELENGHVLTLSEFLENISEEQAGDEIVIFGGEVPWPKDGNGKKKEKANKK